MRADTSTISGSKTQGFVRGLGRVAHRCRWSLWAPHHTNVAVARAVDLPLIFLFGVPILAGSAKGAQRTLHRPRHQLERRAGQRQLHFMISVRRASRRTPSRTTAAIETENPEREVKIRTLQKTKDAAPVKDKTIACSNGEGCATRPVPASKLRLRVHNPQPILQR